MSERHGVQEATLKNWANLGYITSSRISNHLLLDEESFVAYLEAHKREGLQADYLAKIIEEKKLERDFIISKYDDMIYVLKTQEVCAPLYKVIISELSELFTQPTLRDIFYSISTGEPIERVARRHRISYDHVLRIYNSLLKVLEDKKAIIATYRKRAIDYRLQCLSANTKITKKKDKRINDLSISKIADTRITNALRLEGVFTVGQLLDYVSDVGWNVLPKLRGVGNTSYIRLLTKLDQMGIKDYQLGEILAPYLAPK